jgi:hypothetical protein
MPDIGLPAWMVWALLSAVFAALTAIFAKVGVASIDPDCHMHSNRRHPCDLGRHPGLARAFATVSKHFRSNLWVPGPVGNGDGGVLGLLFSCASTRGCRARGPGRQAERRSGCRFRGALLERASCPSPLAGRAHDYRRRGSHRGAVKVAGGGEVAGGACQAWRAPCLTSQPGSVPRC